MQKSWENSVSFPEKISLNTKKNMMDNSREHSTEKINYVITLFFGPFSRVYYAIPYSSCYIILLFYWTSPSGLPHNFVKTVHHHDRYLLLLYWGSSRTENAFLHLIWVDTVRSSILDFLISVFVQISLSITSFRFN